MMAEEATNANLWISELARLADVNRETVRYYERIGLLRPVERTSAGYRLYGRESVERLRFIRRAQTFGFTLEQIKELLELEPENPRSCGSVVSMLDEKLEEISHRMREMKRFYKRLLTYRERCGEALEDGDACPLILEAGPGGSRDTKS